MFHLKVLPLSSLMILLTQAGSASEISVKQAWSRATPSAAPVAVGFATVINSGKDGDRLLGIDAAISESVELHETTIVDGIARMRGISELQIDAGSTVVLKPGGLHLMFIRPKAPFREGGQFTVRLRFEKAGTKEVEFTVHPIGARDASHVGHGAKRP